MAERDYEDFAGSNEAQGIVERHANSALVRYNENMAPVRAASPIMPLSSIMNRGQALTPAQEFAIPPEEVEKVNIKPMSSEEFHRGVAAMRTPPGYPTEREHVPESSLGREEYPAGGAAIPERPIEATPTTPSTEPGWTHYAEGIDYKLGKEAPAGDKAARERVMSEARESGRTGMDIARGEDIRRTEEAAKSRAGDEFDFGSFKSAISSMGGKPSRKVQLAVLGHMYDTFQKRMEAQGKLKELEVTHGEGSPAMISARSGAAERRVQTEISLMKAPHEVNKMIADEAKSIAETKKVPAEIAHLEAQSNYWKKMSDAPEMRKDSAYLKDLIEAHDKSLPGSPEQRKYQAEIDSIIGRRKGELFVEDFNKKYPRLAGKVVWDGEKLVEAK